MKEKKRKKNKKGKELVGKKINMKGESNQLVEKEREKRNKGKGERIKEKGEN